jgi:hypothetical protein
MEYQSMCPTSSLVPELPALPPSGPSSPGLRMDSTSLTLVGEWNTRTCALPPHWCWDCQLCRLQGRQVQVIERINTGYRMEHAPFLLIGAVGTANFGPAGQSVPDKRRNVSCAEVMVLYCTNLCYTVSPTYRLLFYI